MSFTLAIVEGRLGKDPEIRSTQTGKQVASFSVGCDVGFGDNKETFWANCVAWGQQAEFVSKHTKKGSGVRVVGELKSRKWTDKSGNERTTTEITAKDIAFAESRGGQSSGRSSAPAQTRAQAAPTPRRTDPVADAAEIQDSDIPW